MFDHDLARNTLPHAGRGHDQAGCNLIKVGHGRIRFLWKIDRVTGIKRGEDILIGDCSASPDLAMTAVA